MEERRPYVQLTPKKEKIQQEIQFKRKRKMYAEHIIYDRYVGREFNNNTEDASGRTSVVGEQQTTTAT